RKTLLGRLRHDISGAITIESRVVDEWTSGIIRIAEGNRLDTDTPGNPHPDDLAIDANGSSVVEQMCMEIADVGYRRIAQRPAIGQRPGRLGEEALRELSDVCRAEEQMS